MPTTISGSSGVTFPAGGTGNPTSTVVGINDTQTLTNKTLTTPNINSAPFATVSGTAPIYPCRAWVNFDGTGTVSIRASGNVSSITDGGTGIYTVNFTTAMPDINYCIQVTSGANTSAINAGARFETTAPTTTAASVFTANASGTSADAVYVNASIYR